MSQSQTPQTISITKGELLMKFSTINARCKIALARAKCRIQTGNISQSSVDQCGGARVTFEEDYRAFVKDIKDQKKWTTFKTSTASLLEFFGIMEAGSGREYITKDVYSAGSTPYPAEGDLRKILDQLNIATIVD